MDNEKHSSRLRRSGSLVLGVVLGIAAAVVVRPASGQANMSCVTEQLNDNEFTCDDCTSYETCYNTATESLYYTVKGQRFDCDGYDCEQATKQLQDLCCDTEPASSTSADDKDDGGCATAPHAAAPDAAVSVSWALAALVALRRVRKRAR